MQKIIWLTGILLLILTRISVAQDSLKLIVPTGHGETGAFNMQKSGDGRFMASYTSGYIKVWDLFRRKELGSFNYGTTGSGNYFDIQSIPGSSQFLILAQGNLYLIDPVTMTQKKFHSQPGMISLLVKDATTAYFSTNQQGAPSIFSVDLNTLKTQHLYSVPIKKTGFYKFNYHYKLLSMLKGDILLARGAYTEGYYLINTKTWVQQKAWADSARNLTPTGPNGPLIEVVKGQEADKTAEYLMKFVDPFTWEIKKTISLGTLYRFGFASTGEGKWRDAQNNRYYLKVSDYLFTIDENTLSMEQKVPINEIIPGLDEPPMVTSILPDPVRNTIYFAYAGKRNATKFSSLILLNPTTLKEEADFTGISITGASRVFAAGNDLEFYIQTSSDQLKKISIGEEGLHISGFPGKTSDVAFDPSGKTVYTGHFLKPEVVIHKDGRARTVKQFARTMNGITRLAVSPDGRYAASKNNRQVLLTDFQAGRLVFQEEVNYYSSYKSKNEITFNPQSNKFVVSVSQFNQGSAALNKLICYGVTGSAKLWEKRLESSYNNLHFTPNGEELIAFSTGNRSIVRINPSTGATISTIKLPQPRIYDRYIYSENFVLDFSSNLEYCAMGYAGSNIQIHDVKSGRIINQLKFDGGSITDLKFIKGGQYLIAVGTDNLLRLYNTTQGEQLLSLALFDNGDKFLVVSPDGRFAGSQAAINGLHFVKKGTIIELESLFEQFYTPRLIAQVLSNEKFTPPPVDISKVKVPPTVRLTYNQQAARNLVVANDIPAIPVKSEQAKLTITADAKEDVIQEIRLYHNGKLIQQSTRNLVVTDDKAKTEKKEYNIQLVPGQNLFKAIALNSQRTESMPDELILNYEVSASAPTPGPSGSGLTLHLLVVGINEYKNPRYNLNYAYKDAKTFKEMIESKNKTVFGSIKSYLISNAEADKKGIVQAFTKIASEAGPRDMFVFYYAGHGVMAGKEKQEFYLVPHDVTQLYGADEQMKEKALGSSEMQELSRKIGAQKQLFILDACQSAGALQSIAVRGATEEKAIAQLARSTGTHWLTASGSEQFAAEFDQLGHGVFTFTLLEALSGKGDNGDGRITVNELKAYLESQVPELTQKYKGTPQYPASYGYGQDFPVSIIIK